jgi:hypothetical protein
MHNDSTSGMQRSCLHRNQVPGVLISSFMPYWPRETNEPASEFTFPPPLMVQSDTSLNALGSIYFSTNQAYHEEAP